MGGDSNQEKSDVDTELQTELLAHNHDDRKGGLKTMPFIIVNEAFERVACSVVLPNMIFYLMDVYHMTLVTGTTVITIWTALSDGLSIFGAFISDSYLGRYRVILIGSLSSLLGMVCLWLTSVVPKLTPSSCPTELTVVPETGCNPPQPTQLAFLYSCFILITIGSCCIRPCSVSFGVDQLKHHRTTNNQRLIDSFFNWIFISIAVSAIVGLTVIVYIQEQLGWQVVFAVAVLIMLCSTFVFVLGSSLFIKVEVGESVFSGLIQVLVAAFKNRRIRLDPNDCYNHTNEMDQVEPTDNLRFLNKACVVRDLNFDSSVVNPWTMSTVENVESLKSLIYILPLWSSGILIFVLIAQTFPILQAKTMNRHVTPWFKIPPASFTLFTCITVTIWIPVYDRILVPLLAKYTHEPRGFNSKTRMGIAFVISIVAMIVSAIVETKRRGLARENTTVDMSAMWLVPQFVLLGLAHALNSVGQMEFYYSELPKNMSSVAISMSMVSTGISGLVGSLIINVVDWVTTRGGNISWLSSDINEGHLDYYYWLLTFLDLLNFFYFLICCRVHRNFSSSGSHEFDEEG